MDNKGNDPDKKGKSTDEENESDISLMVTENDKEDGIESEMKDDDLPEVLTMNELEESGDADDESDVDESVDFDVSELSPGLQIEELSSKQIPQNPVFKADTNTGMDIVASFGDETREICLEEIATKNEISHQNEITNKENPEREKQSELKTNNFLTERSNLKFEIKTLDRANKYHTYQSSILEQDDDIIMMRAVSALRRADKISPTYRAKNYSSLYSSNLNFTSSLKTTNLSIMNTSTLPWQPVGMSTPLQTKPRRLRVYGSSYDCDFCGSSFDKSNFMSVPFRGATRSPLLTASDLESGVGRSCYTSGESLSGIGPSRKKLSPVMEDILRRKEILKYGLQEVGQMRTGIANYSTGRFIPRTHPLSNADRRRLYGKTVFGLDFDNHVGKDFRRSSWPSEEALSMKLSQSSRSLDLPVFPPPAKYAKSTFNDMSMHSACLQARVYGKAFKVPIPAPASDNGNNTDSGFADWKQNISR